MEFTEALPSCLDVDYKSLEDRYVAAFLGGFDHLKEIEMLLLYKQTKLLQSKSKQSRIVRVRLDYYR